jgi:hypothetical protein
MECVQQLKISTFTPASNSEIWQVGMVGNAKKRVDAKADGI